MKMVQLPSFLWCIIEDIIHLFPHSTSDLVFNITPLTCVPPSSAPKLTITSKPTITSQPRTTTSAPSSTRKETEGENLIPRRRRIAMDDIRVIRRTPQQGESSQAIAKITLCTSGAGELTTSQLMCWKNTGLRMKS